VNYKTLLKKNWIHYKRKFHLLKARTLNLKKKKIQLQRDLYSQEDKCGSLREKNEFLKKQLGKMIQ